MTPKYKTVLLKISGEALAGEKGTGYDQKVVSEVVGEIKELVGAGIKVGIVVGGGNFWRGRQSTDMDRPTADYMGMLATAMNALALRSALEAETVPAEVFSALAIDKIAETYDRRKVLSALCSGKVAIFACGTGHPFFSTDTAAALRAAEIEADALLLAKNVDGIYDSDPKINPAAKRFDEISYSDFLALGLKAMDATAVTICRENNIPVIAFGFEKNSIVRAATGEKIGTRIG